MERRTFLRALLAAPALAAAGPLARLGLFEDRRGELDPITYRYEDGTALVDHFGSGRFTDFGAESETTVRLWSKKLADEAFSSSYLGRFAHTDAQRSLNRHMASVLERKAAEFYRSLLLTGAPPRV